jgi:hypothetical protein
MIRSQSARWTQPCLFFSATWTMPPVSRRWMVRDVPAAAASSQMPRPASGICARRRSESHLAAVPLICFKWHQRPENVLAGHLTWTNYRPPNRPNAVRILHHKTGELVWLPLADLRGPLFPELTAYLDSLEHLGVPMVLMRPKRKDAPARQFLLRTARNLVRAAARKAALSEDLTLAACRHGGLTELGDAELTEQCVMALSGHRKPEAARLYVKRTYRE